VATYYDAGCRFSLSMSDNTAVGWGPVYRVEIPPEVADIARNPPPDVK
jgi:hypothetical protein